MKQKGILIVVSGFAGTGKGTIMKELVKRYGDQYALSVSMTTRAPREGERHGVEYYFATKEEFEADIARDGFLEYACYCDNYYGTPKYFVEKQLQAGRDVFLEIEIQGALQIKEKFPEAMLIFILPPSVPEVYNRLKKRGTETLEVIHQRMNRAAEESRGIEQYDYILVNDDLETCIESTHRTIQSEKNRSFRNIDFIEQIRREFVEFKEKEGDL